MSKYRVSGSVSPGYESVRRRFEAQFAAGRLHHSQLCVYVGAERVVDLWGASREGEDAGAMAGKADKDYDGDSLQVVYSNTKTVAAVAVAVLVDRGLLSYGDKISKFWPEFAQAGKDSVTLADLLRHEAGLSYLDAGSKFPISDFYTESLKRDSLGPALAAQRQHFPADTRREYHGLSRGLYLNEIFRRVDPQKRTIGEFVAQEFREGLGADVYVGSVPAEVEADRFFLNRSWSAGYTAAVCLAPDILSKRSLVGIGGLLKMGQIAKNKVMSEGPVKEGPREKKGSWIFTEGFRQAELPSVNGVCSARGLANLSSAMSRRGVAPDGQRVLGEETWAAMHADPTVAKMAGYDPPGVTPSAFTQGGVNLFKVYESDSDSVQRLCRLREGWHGWFGLGGSTMQWHVDLQIGFAHTTTLIAVHDPAKVMSALLQDEVARCAARCK